MKSAISPLTLCDRVVVSQALLLSRSPSVIPLAARGALLTACSLLAALALGPRAAVGPALLLLAIAALASLPFPYAPPLARPGAEMVLTALLIGALGEAGTPFLPYLVVPAITVGLGHGIRRGLTIGAAGSVVLLATSAALTWQGAEQLRTLAQHLQWALIVLSVGFLAGWVASVRHRDDPQPEPAYSEAHRLLSELHLVARQLNLGLDTPTLAAVLCDELSAATGSSANCVFARGRTGLFHRLSGGGALPVDGALLEEAWLSAGPVTSTQADVTHLVLPVRMGERVVAVTVSSLGSTTNAEAEVIRQAMRVVSRSGSRLASAMLFDDVRGLATRDERLRLARDIHDGIAQDVASLGFFIDDAMHGADPATGHKLTALRAEVRRIVGELRLSIFDLRLGADQALTVGTAIGDHARRVGGQCGLTVHVTVEESDARLPQDAEHALVRMAQEALTNVRRHANASTIWVECRVNAPEFVLSIEDDGSGLGQATDASMGLKGIHERAARMGGRVRIENRAGGGTLVEVTNTEVPDASASARSVGSAHG